MSEEALVVVAVPPRVILVGFGRLELKLTGHLVAAVIEEALTSLLVAARTSEKTLADLNFRAEDG